MKLPYFPFYPGDWLRNSNLARCSHEEKGAWVDVLCLMHDSDEHGILRWPLNDIAMAIHCKPQILSALIKKGVLKGCDNGMCEPFVYRPQSGRKQIGEYELIPAQHGPIWFSTRMVKDAYLRDKRKASSTVGLSVIHGSRGGIDG